MDPYHSRIFERYSSLEDRVVEFNISHRLNNGLTLKCTEQRTSSKTGLLIDTGMTVPREAYYPVFAFFPDLNILAYDKRGHGDSEGIIDNIECFTDNLKLAAEWKKQRNLDTLIGFGHSYGGMVMACAATSKDPPYDAIIAAAPPVELRKAGGVIPDRFTRTSVYLYNATRLKHSFSWDEVVRHHQHLDLTAFSIDPRIVAMRIDGAERFNAAMEKMIGLNETLININIDAYFLYGGEDKRLGIRGKFTGEYLSMRERCGDLGFPMKLLPGLSHRFNRKPEREFAFSYNNNVGLTEIRRIIDFYRG